MATQWFGVNGFYALYYGVVAFKSHAFVCTLMYAYDPRRIQTFSVRCVHWTYCLRTGRRVCKRGTHGGSGEEGRGAWEPCGERERKFVWLAI